MTDYKAIFGKKIKFLTADLSAAEAEGEVWYSGIDATSSAAGTFNFKVGIATGVASASAPMLGVRKVGHNFGTQTANVAAGGEVPGRSAITEEYNGTGWSSGENLPAAVNAGFGTGTLTAGLAYGGSTDPGGQEGVVTTNEYDGTDWTAGGDLNQARYSQGSGAGTQTSALCASGYHDTNVTNTEEYNGSAWTAGEAIDTAKRAHGQVGTQTASLIFGGIDPNGRTNSTELYDGTDYSAGPNLNQQRDNMGSAGIQTLALGMGGYKDPGYANNVEQYDGTSWSEFGGNLATARDGCFGSRGGTVKAAMVSGGATPSLTAVTEEWNMTVMTVTQGVWASGTNYPGAIQDAAGAGPQTAAVVYGGWMTAVTNTTSEYDGSSWTAGGNLGTARSVYQIGTGSQTAALCGGGYSTAKTGVSEEYDGSSWTEGNNMNNARSSITGGGVQTSAIFAGGSMTVPSPPSSVTKAESYNGTSWTNETDTPVAHWGSKAFSGTSETSNIFIGVGEDSEDTFSYDGSSWTDLGHTLVTFQNTPAGATQQGSTTSALIAGGFGDEPGTIIATGQQYDGSAWATAPSLGTARRGGAGAGTYASCLAVGGEEPSQSNKTEEWTGESSAINLETVTDS